MTCLPTLSPEAGITDAPDAILNSVYLTAWITLCTVIAFWLTQKFGRRPILIPTTDILAQLVADHADVLQEAFIIPRQNAGLFRSLRPAGPLDKPEEIDGVALEGLVAQHLIAWNSYRGEKNSLYYWRTRSGTEVDFILYGAEAFWAIEVKNTSRVRDEDLRSLRSFKEDYPECHAFFLYRGKEKLLKNGIQCIPCDQFLANLNPNSTKIF